MESTHLHSVKEECQLPAHPRAKVQKEACEASHQLTDAWEQIWELYNFKKPLFLCNIEESIVHYFSDQLFLFMPPSPSSTLDLLPVVSMSYTLFHI